jgi:hypothetical protein
VKKLLKWAFIAAVGFVGVIIAIVVLVAVLSPAPPDPTTGRSGAGGPVGPEDSLVVGGTAEKVSCVVQDDRNQRSIDVSAPEVIKLDATSSSIVVATCQKMEAKGRLTLVLSIDDRTEAKGVSTAEFGTLTVGYPE